MYGETNGYKVERIAADGSINGGGPIRKLYAVGVKGGAAASNVQWYEDVNAADPTKLRGGVSVGIGLWDWAIVNEAITKAFFDISAADVVAVAVYLPGGSA